MIKRTSGWRTAAVAAAILLGFSVLIAADQTDFSGSWVINMEKSDSMRGGGGPGGGPQGGPDRGRGGRGRRGGGGGMMAVPSEMEITQNEGILTVRQIGQGGQARELILDPSAGEVESPRGMISVAWEGSNLVVSRVMERETPRGTMSMSDQQTWSLSKDRNTLTQKITISTPRGDRTLKRVYDRKSEQ